MSTFISTGLGVIPFYGITTNQTYTVRVNGSPVFCIAGSLKIDLSIGRRSQASFNLHTDTNTHFYQYQQVKIYDNNGTLVFSGYISTVKEQKPGFQPSLIHTVTCTDQHFLADKRVIAKVYTGMTIGAIVQDIVTSYLSAEGVTLNQALINDGLIPSSTLYPSTTLYPNGNVGVVPTVTFAYCTIAAALDQLATTASSAGVPYYWAIDQNKRLIFQPYTGITNSNIIDGTWVDNKTNFATVQRQNPKYRNREWLTGGVGKTAQRTETFTSDGQATTWTMGYALASAPTVTVNGTGQSVGLKGATGSAFYWQQGDPAIVQDSAAAKIPASQKLVFTYVGQYPSITVTQNDAEIQAQAGRDGTSGLVEVVDDDPSLTDLPTAVTEGARFLGLYGVQGTILTLTTQVPGYVPGQLVTVNLPWHNLSNAQMLVESVSIADSDNINIWYTITCLQGPYDNTWVSFFSQLIQQSQQQPATAVTVGSTAVLPPVSIHTTTFNSAATRFRLTSGPQPPTHTSRDAAIRFLLRVSGNLTQTSQAFSATLPAATATVTATVATSSSGGGGTGSGKLLLYSFGDNTGADPFNLAANKYCAGTNILLYWTQLEPTSEGNFDWSPLETLLNHWGTHNKKCIVRVSVSGQNSSSWRLPYSAQGTPNWVFNAGVQKITGGGNTIVPQYWNSTFQAKLKGFIQAMAAKYDGDARIAGFQIAVGMGGECKTDSTKITNKLQIMQAAGYTDALWFTYIQFVMNTYISAFTKSQLIMASDTDVIGHTTGYSQDTTIGYITAQNGKIWIQNDGLVVNQAIRSSLQAAFQKIPVVSEQRNAVLAGSNSGASGDTMAQDLAIAKTQATSKIFLVFQQDINNGSNNSTFDQYVQTF